MQLPDIGSGHRMPFFCLNGGFVIREFDQPASDVFFFSAMRDDSNMLTT